MEKNNPVKFDEKIKDSIVKTKTCEDTGENDIKSKMKVTFDKVKTSVTKVGTRTVVVVCSVLLISLAVILNFALQGSEDIPTSELELPEISNEAVAAEDDTYFESTVLNRKQARDEAIAVLQTVVNNESTIPEAKQTALADISRIAEDIEREANIETLIKSKGFEECIAVVTGTNASVIVKSDGLMQNELSQIKEIVYEQAGIDPVNIKIVEKSA